MKRRTRKRRRKRRQRYGIHRSSKRRMETRKGEKDTERQEEKGSRQNGKITTRIRRIRTG